MKSQIINLIINFFINLMIKLLNCLNDLLNIRIIKIIKQKKKKQFLHSVFLFIRYRINFDNDKIIFL